MSSNPIKLFAFVGVAAIVAAGMVSHNFEPALSPQSQKASPATPSQSWWSSMFGGMELRREPASAPITPKPQPAAAQVPAAKPASGFGAVVLKQDRAGHYNAQIEIDGQRIPMLVDTGATVVALRSEDASRLGINPMPNDFNVSISTANGEIKAARANLREVRLENITVTDVQAVVLPAGVLSQSLLGMSFMKKLSKFQISDGELILKP
jgi:aspartyl protease family protein